MEDDLRTILSHFDCGTLSEDDSVKAIFSLFTVSIPREDKIDRAIKCFACDGKGYHQDGDYKNECYTCSGAGFI